tara:strand:- start:98 stop:793 length:696 start_codon:yes stop_codon:yes gene_type:complete
MIPKSTYFNFDKFNFLNEKVNISNFKGWSGLSVTRFQMSKNSVMVSDEIDSKFPQLNDKEKIFVIIEGSINFIKNNDKIKLNKLDAVDFVSSNQKFKMISDEETTLYMIGSEKSKSINDETHYFNFLKDIKPRNLWGGQIISRPYEGKEITLVLFDLKSGFKFEDKGHPNEQITWLTDGKMSFYADSQKDTLVKNYGISIGANHAHGGMSEGAIGFDAFFPKRKEEKYRKN